jgi:hypothetical protein
VARLPAKGGEPEGEKVAAVAVGLGPSFFRTGEAPRFDPPIKEPAGFDLGTPEDRNFMLWDSPSLSPVSRMADDVLFYVVSVFDARVARFIEAIRSTPEVVSIGVDRGYQRVDGDEAFGYRDGVRIVMVCTAGTMPLIRARYDSNFRVMDAGTDYGGRRGL